MTDNSERGLAPGDWRELERDERSSTISHFLTGWISDNGHEVLVWEGVQREGEYVLEAHIHDEAPKDAAFIIELLEPESRVGEHQSNSSGTKSLTVEKFAETPAGAITAAVNMIDDVEEKRP